MLMNESGDVTSHLMGFFYRTIRMVDHGIKPCYIFDGKPPELKGGVVSFCSLFSPPMPLLSSGLSQDAASTDRVVGKTICCT